VARKLLRIILAALLALVVLDGAAWLWATERLRAGYEAWTAGMRAEGWSVGGGTPRRAGWPFTAELVIPDPALVGGDAVVPGGMTWTGERVRLRLSPLAPRLLEMLPEGVQRVRLATLPEAGVTAAALAASVPLSGEGVAELRGRAVRVAVAGVVVEAATLRAAAVPGGVRAAAEVVALPQRYAWPLGATIEAVSAEAVVVGAPSPAPPGTAMAEQAARWRDAGGRVDVPQFALRWGPLSVAGSGSGGLDAGLQPRAKASVRLQGWRGALDQLVEGGAVKPGAALAARAVLGLFAKASQGEVILPVVVSGGMLDAGGIPLFKVPPIAWP
jgi:hypothetical protein